MTTRPPLITKIPAPDYLVSVNSKWNQSFPLELIGQDAMTAGRGQSADQPNPVALTYWQANFPIENRGWVRGWPRELISQDAMTAGRGQTNDQPNPTLGRADPIDLRTWIESFPLELLGQDQMIAGRTRDFPNPRGPTALNPDVGRQSLALANVVPAPPFAQTNWPNPVLSRADPVDLKTWTRGPLPLLLGQDLFPARGQTADQPNPRGAASYINASWTWAFSPGLIGQDKFPARGLTADQPNPRGPLTFVNLTWSDSFKLSLIGNDKLPTKGMSLDMPNPRQLWIPQYDVGYSRLALTTIASPPFHQNNWPNPVLVRANPQDFIAPSNIRSALPPATSRAMVFIFQ